MTSFTQNKKDLLATLVNQCWRFVSGPIILLFIPLYLTPEQQGYWYLFGSISMLSVLADLGFTNNIVLQFSAHEYAHLHFDKTLLAGEEIYLKRLGSFFCFTLKWILTVCVIAFPLVYVIGIAFFVRDKVIGIYTLPWTIYTIGSVISLVNNAILAFIGGLNKIQVIEVIRLIVAVINTAVIALILIAGGNIYALAVGTLLSGSFIFVLVFGIFRRLLRQLLTISKGFSYNWKREILPLFTKFAIGSVCGFFVLSIYTPAMHYFHGPIYSGKTGITFTLTSAIGSLSSIWIYTILPKINMLVSQKKWRDLDRLFKRRFLLSIITYLFFGLALSAFLLLFGKFFILPKIISRFLPWNMVTVLFFCYFFQTIMSNWAYYLRAHKQEPYMAQAIAAAPIVFIGTLIAGKFLSIEYFFLGYVSYYVIFTPINYITYLKCKKKWHSGGIIYNVE
ncbi:MAG: hypothetical protein LBP74_09770 [Treponema sp.]|jgi:hypothetical protein|nr:hypothetical protein [Treponema sp.]